MAFAKLLRVVSTLLALSFATSSIARIDGDAALEAAFRKGKDAIQSQQLADGSFRNYVDTSSTLYTTMMVLLYEYLGVLEQKRENVDGLMKWSWRNQNADGGLPGYPGGPSEVGISVQTYLAAKVSGESEETPRMRRLAAYFKPRRSLLGELQARPFLMLFGIDRSGYCAPDFAQSAALAMESRLPWFKAFLYPLLHIMSTGHIHALSPEKIPHAIQPTGRLCPKKLAERSVEKTNGQDAFWRWMEKALNSDGTLFDYTPTTVTALMALSTYEGDAAKKAHFQAMLEKGLKTIETFQIRHPDGSIQQSPGDAAVAETTVVILGMILSDVPGDDPMLAKGREFVLSAQHAKTGAFGMSSNNEKNPDSDDTSTSITTLRMMAEKDGTYSLPENAEFRARLKKGVDWTLTLQNRNGGFGTWEKDRLGISKPIFDLTGLVLSESVMEHSTRAAAMLSLYRDEDPVYAKAHDRVLRYIRSRQLKDGSYTATWFVNYVFGTAIALNALGTTPEKTYRQPKFQASIHASLDFIAAKQRADGGFSESPESYLEKRMIPLPYSSPSQTGLIVASLLSFSSFEKYRNWERVGPIVERAIAFLIASQKADGLWHDPTLTGVVFPKIEYAIYPTLQESFAVQALGMYRVALKNAPRR